MLAASLSGLSVWGKWGKTTKILAVLTVAGWFQVHFELQVRLRLSGVHTGWSGALRFGFTSLDPSELVTADIPKYACPDLVTRPGYWAKALPERLALKDNVLSFWADRHGRVFYSINEGEPILFHCGLSISCPLWAIIDIYGITQEVTLLGECLNNTAYCPPKRTVRYFVLCRRRQDRKDYSESKREVRETRFRDETRESDTSQS